MSDNRSGEDFLWVVFCAGVSTIGILLTVWIMQFVIHSIGG